MVIAFSYGATLRPDRNRSNGNIFSCVKTMQISEQYLNYTI